MEMYRPAWDFDAPHLAVSRIRAKPKFFIGGSIKSGTTWVQLLLNQHPDVSCHGESHLFDSLGPLLNSALDSHAERLSVTRNAIFDEMEKIPDLSSGDRNYLLATAFNLALARQPKSDTAMIVGEKTPDNIRFLEQMDRLFDQAKFVHVIRDGRDCAVSGWFQNLRINETRAYELYPTMTDYVRCVAREWVVDLELGMRFARREPSRYHMVRYEDLYTHPIPTLAAIFHFLGVDSDYAVAERCSREASFETLTRGRGKGEEDRSSFFRKGMPGDWRNHFTSEMTSIFGEIAGEWLAIVGEDAAPVTGQA